MADKITIDELYLKHTKQHCWERTCDYFLLSYEMEKGITKITAKTVQVLLPSVLSWRFRKQTTTHHNIYYNYPTKSGVWRYSHSLERVDNLACEILNEWKQ